MKNRKNLLIISVLLFFFSLTNCNLHTTTNNQTNPETDNFCTVSFQTIYGTAPEPLIVQENTILTSSHLPSLTADGYTFNGWYDGEMLVESDNFMVTKDITLTASWSPIGNNNNENETTIMYTISYESSYGEIPNSIEVKENTILSENQLPLLTVDGYNFEGWFDGDTLAEPGKYTVIQDVTFTAQWTRNNNDTVNSVWILTRASGVSYSQDYTVLWVEDSEHYETSMIYTYNSSVLNKYYILRKGNFTFDDIYKNSNTFSGATASYGVVDPETSFTTCTLLITKDNASKTYQKSTATITAGSFSLENNLGFYNYHIIQETRIFGSTSTISTGTTESYYLIENGEKKAYYLPSSHYNWYYIFENTSYNSINLQNNISSDDGKSYSAIYELIEITDNKMTIKCVTKQKGQSETVSFMEYTKFDYGYDSGERYMSYHLSEEDFSVFEE